MKKVVLILLSVFGGVSAADVPVYFGTQSGAGIYKGVLDSETGKLSGVGVAVEMPGTGSLSISPDRKVLYSTTRTADENGKMKMGGVASYGIGANMELKHLSTQSSKGRGACHVFAGPKGKNLYVANYGSGCVASFQVDGKGNISPAVSHLEHKGTSVNEKRQTAPHAHSIYTSPDNKFVYAADLGTDEVWIYKLDGASGEMKLSGKAKVPAGGGPRHMAFGKRGSELFVLNELSLTVTKFSRNNENGELTLVKTSTVSNKPKDENLTCSEIRISDDGKFLYAAKRDLANKGRDTICVMDPNSLEVIQEQAAGVWIPRNFNISPSGKWLVIAGQKSNKVVVLPRDLKTGRLGKSSNSVEMNKPMWVLFP